MNKDTWFCAVIPAPFGAVGIRTEAGLLRELEYLPASHALQEPATALTQEVTHQIQCYFENPAFQFTVPLAPIGTEHQRKVWQAISQIPLGQVINYGQIAKQIASAPRAVGQACGANWYPIIIPCHRVTAAKGLGGFAHHSEVAGFHLTVKRWLLAHEGVHGY
ncbi:methylated-DNA--[protein]-cysteine S-methyltransferase [Solimicrobium silvestre]|uniref:Ogt: methylated-DNA-[protein]-cysteine S-methyltransferase n=1 Tax=Solimicrobium silvestre TaxID=2099400 RepID=A0A2S9H0T7_9BURK|nr:methylated-DNA--[protein]-cysteine S-methyltransferase [Solimicrobium silvestre]PRC93591.1 ogt: methylated-DNA-[protein]-cysteine S-methyltransferase [Solimicrobium silvestre]